MGFAFENFDVVGRWRDKYKSSREPINTSATMANGNEIADIVEFKKMLTYATGRQLEAVDRGEVDLIVFELTKKEDRLRDLVHLVVQSNIFLSK